MVSWSVCLSDAHAHTHRSYSMSFGVGNPAAGVPLTGNGHISLEARGSFPTPPWTPTPCCVKLPILTGWHRAEITQSTFYPDADNNITVTLDANVDISAACELTITGLTGSATPDSAALPITGANASAFASTAAWTQSTGQLKVTLAATAPLRAAAAAYAFTFSLRNPAAGQEGRSASITIESDACNPGVFAPTVPDSPDFLLLRPAGDALPGAVLGGNQTRPLFTIDKGFVVKRIGQVIFMCVFSCTRRRTCPVRMPPGA